jgi:hypothetical protein
METGAGSKQMKRHSLTRIVVLINGIVLLFIGFLWLGHDNAKLREETVAAKERLNKFKALELENNRLSKLLAETPAPHPIPEQQKRELLDLRGKVGLLRQRALQLENVEKERLAVERKAEIPVEPLPIRRDFPKTAWVYTSNSSPESPLLSILHAMQLGDLENYGAYSTPEEKASLETQLQEGIGAEEISRRMKRSMTLLNNVRILQSTEMEEDRMRLRVLMDSVAGSREGEVKLRKVSGIWKFDGFLKIPETSNPREGFE